jgi:hypothetical protein
LWGILKNFKIRSGSYSGPGLSIYVKNRIKISLDCPFKGLGAGAWRNNTVLQYISKLYETSCHLKKVETDGVGLAELAAPTKIKGIEASSPLPQ